MVARCSFTERLTFRASSGSSQYRKWKGDGEMAWTSTPILSMSRSRCSTDVRHVQTFSICLRLVARESSFENRDEGSRSGETRCLTISSATGWWTWQWMSTQNGRRPAAWAREPPPRAALDGHVKSMGLSLGKSGACGSTVAEA
jgi:hypothetical protein